MEPVTFKLTCLTYALPVSGGWLPFKKYHQLSKCCGENTTVANFSQQPYEKLREWIFLYIIFRYWYVRQKFIKYNIYIWKSKWYIYAIINSGNGLLPVRTKPSSEAIQVYFQLDPSELNQLKFEPQCNSFDKIHLKYPIHHGNIWVIFATMI